MPEPVYADEIVIVLAGEAEAPEDTTKRDKKKSGDEGDSTGKGKDAPTHGLPKVVLITKDGREIENYVTEPWPEDFSEADGGLIADLVSGEVIYKVNYDNAYHLKYKPGEHGTVAREVVTEKYILGHADRPTRLRARLSVAPEVKGRRGGGFGGVRRRLPKDGRPRCCIDRSCPAENLPKIVDASSVQPDV